MRNGGESRPLSGLGGLGVREVPVLKLRGIVLIECLYTLISKIKN